MEPIETTTMENSSQQYEAETQLTTNQEAASDEMLSEERIRLEQLAHELTERETKVQEAEKAVEGQRTQLAMERNALENDKREIERQLDELADREMHVDADKKSVSEREQNVHQREMAVKEAERDMEKKADDAHRELEKMLFDAREESYARMKAEQQKLQLAVEQEIAEKRSVWEQELAELEKKARDTVEQLYRDAEAERSTRRSELTKELDSLRKASEEERSRMLTDANSEIDSRRAALQAETAARTEQLAAKEKELSAREQTLDEERAKTDRASSMNNRDKKRQALKEQELSAREENINEEVRKKAEELIQNYEAQLLAKDAALEQLRGQLRQLTAERISEDNFKMIYGDRPELIQAELARLRTDNEELQNRLAKRPDEAVQIERDQLRDNCERMQTESREFQKQIAALTESQWGLERIQAENARLQDQYDDLQQRFDEQAQHLENAHAEIMRLSSSQARLAEREERIKAIQSGRMDPLQGTDILENQPEYEWLDRIWENCGKFGMVFPKRILYAFHTALKISDWSMITVLSGVSGTGKSELPKLYAAFGGMNFISVPVQPSWDSQESMLGFFNSIDNRFEPEPLLRFLYQCTEDAAFSKYMSIVLLDEMNLAHVEHYFADFLSKLESRRSLSKDMQPTVEVKLGAGVEPYQLKLDRSILWTGTMNQDETTKSLSDKVLDRGLVVYFPRPERLTSRNKMNTLKKAIEESDRKLMTRSAWQSWVIRDLDKALEKVGEEIQKTACSKMDRYRTIIESINSELEGTGRALGHRVWQAIEYYVYNYPTVRKAMADGLEPDLKAAMDVAFEDQLVQKVMPKLRGIETRGESGKRLEKIEDLLEKEGFDHLKDDFELAMELGYGQFIWSSAKYIQADEENDTSKNASASGTESDTGN